MARSARDAFDSKNLLEIVFFCKKNLISLETTAETKESGMKLKSGRAGSGRSSYGKSGNRSKKEERSRNQRPFKPFKDTDGN